MKCRYWRPLHVGLVTNLSSYVTQRPCNKVPTNLLVSLAGFVCSGLTPKKMQVTQNISTLETLSLRDRNVARVGN